SGSGRRAKVRLTLTTVQAGKPISIDWGELFTDPQTDEAPAPGKEYEFVYPTDGPKFPAVTYQDGSGTSNAPGVVQVPFPDDEAPAAGKEYEFVYPTDGPKFPAVTYQDGSGTPNDQGFVQVPFTDDEAQQRVMAWCGRPTRARHGRCVPGGLGRQRSTRFTGETAAVTACCRGRALGSTCTPSPAGMRPPPWPRPPQHRPRWWSGPAPSCQCAPSWPHRTVYGSPCPT